MAQKNLKLSTLFDYYSPLLGQKHREAVEYYYNDDLSLSEIAEIMGMTRQGARSLIKSGEEKLFEFEDKLKLSEKFAKIDKACDELNKMFDSNAAALEIVKEIQSEVQ